MVAPINATATIDAAGEAITLTVNFATLDGARKAGVDVFKDELSDPFNLVPFLVALAQPMHPDFSSEDAFALVAKHGEAVGNAVAVLFEEFGGQEDEGNVPAPKKRASKKKT